MKTKTILAFTVVIAFLVLSIGCEESVENIVATNEEATAQTDSGKSNDSNQGNGNVSADTSLTIKEKADVPQESSKGSDSKNQKPTSVSKDVRTDAPENTFRVATYNVALNRNSEGQLKSELESGESRSGPRIAEVIQIVRPDILLLCEFDYDANGVGIKSFQKKYLGVPQNGQMPIHYKYVYFKTVNTGQPSGKDLNGDGKTDGPDDAFGFGQFPGKYAMVVLSNLEIDRTKVRTFQNFLWNDMPDCLWPIVPDTQKPFYSDEIKKVFRLSSKSHWDVPIKVGDKTIHFLTSHPTPPVFDKEEDRNGCRNHDEIRLFADYVSGNADYLYDDAGNKGGLPSGSHFVIAGDLNADPHDGDSRDNAINQLLESPDINNGFIPESTGGSYYADVQAGVNAKHKGEDKHDTSDFANDRTVGNMRIDYVLPSKTLNVKSSGVFWPKPDEVGGEAALASDHRLVWIDIER